MTMEQTPTQKEQEDGGWNGEYYETPATGAQRMYNAGYEKGRRPSIPGDGLHELLDFIREEKETRLSELDWLKGMISEYERLVRAQTVDRDPDSEADAILSVKRLYELLKALTQSPGPERDMTP